MLAFVIYKFFMEKIYSVYSYGKHKDNLLLVDHDLWVINGAWQLEKKDGVFLHPLTKNPIDVSFVGYIDYDGDYNTTLNRFQNGEGQHLSDKTAVTIIDTPIAELCKKKYYGIECSCFKCKR